MLLAAHRLRSMALILMALFYPKYFFAQTSNVSEQYLLAAANRDRIAHDLRPLHLNASLISAALQHARLILAHRTISHQFSGEADLAARAANAGAHFSLVTENVAEASNSALIHEL